jgi:dihydroorotase
MTHRTVITNARLLDPASRLDTAGEMVIEDGRIAAFGRGLFADGPPEAQVRIDARGACLAPGLVDMRAELGEPGSEHK